MFVDFFEGLNEEKIEEPDRVEEEEEKEQYV